MFWTAAAVSDEMSHTRRKHIAMRLASSSPLPGAFRARALPRARGSARGAFVLASASSGPSPGARVALVTGSTDGIGLHTACRLASSGHAVILHGRDRARLDARCHGVQAARFGGGVAASYVRDFASLDDVRGLARDVLDHHPALHLLANNAGVFASGAERQLTRDGRELTFQVNVLAPFLLTGRLLPRILETAAESDDVRILNVSSISQTPSIDFDDLEADAQSYSDHRAYAHSKTMMRAFSFELHARVAALAAGPKLLTERRAAAYRAVSVLTCDPGTVNTKMLLAGWGPCGIETYEANDQFALLTDPKFANAEHRGGYHVNLACRRRPEQDSEAEREDRRRLWRVLEEATGLTYTGFERGERASRG